MSEVKIVNPVYRIETERLVVRCYQPADAKLMEKSVRESLEHLKPWMPWAHDEPEPFEVKKNRMVRFRGLFDLQRDYTYGIFNRDETKLLGGTGLHTRLGDRQLEIGYWIHKDHTNKGLVTESTSALIKVAFEVIHIHRVEIHCDPVNRASAAIPRKLGFKHEGTLRANFFFLDHWRDTMIWGLLEDEFPATPAVKSKIKMFDAHNVSLL